MADTQKKYLDAEGVAHLWEKLSMHDYPNNETLVAIIDAIDETKQNKEDEELVTEDKTVIGSINEISSFLTELNNNKVDKEDLISSNILHNEVALSELLQLYMLDIDYQSTLAFNTSEIIISREETTAVLGQAMLGKMVLA